jgi:hypothetical protein
VTFLRPSAEEETRAERELRQALMFSRRDALRWKTPPGDAGFAFNGSSTVKTPILVTNSPGRIVRNTMGSKKFAIDTY